jgi:hypothetical protein
MKVLLDALSVSGTLQIRTENRSTAKKGGRREAAVATLPHSLAQGTASRSGLGRLVQLEGAGRVAAFEDNNWTLDRGLLGSPGWMCTRPA